jgi:predicted NBD/HSP70 family sugar kinase
LLAELRERAEDPAAALAKLADYTAWLGLGLVNVVNLLAPEVVVLGDLFAALPEPVLEVVAARVREHSMVSRAIGHTRVVRSELGRDAQLVGAAELAFNPILEAAAG